MKVVGLLGESGRSILEMPVASRGMARHNGHGPKENMLGVYDPCALRALREKIQAAGCELPDPSFRFIDYNIAWGGWRVQLPGVLGHGVFYFYFSDYGGCEPALIEAQYFRDEAFAKSGVDLYMRVRQRFSKRARNSILNINEAIDLRNGGKSIVGTWMALVDGLPRQKKVQRSYGRIRSRQAAWDEVEKIVKAEMSAEAARGRLAARACGLG